MNPVLTGLVLYVRMGQGLILQIPVPVLTMEVLTGGSASNKTQAHSHS